MSTNSHKHLLYIMYLNDLLQLFKTYTKTLVKEFVLQQSFRLLAGSFIGVRSRSSAKCDMKFFATIQFMVVRYGFGC